MDETITATEIMIEEGLIVDVGKKELKALEKGNLEYTEKFRKSA